MFRCKFGKNLERFVPIRLNLLKNLSVYGIINIICKKDRVAIMEKREETPQRKAKRKYEEVNKEKRRQASGNFGTMIPRPLFEEINAFLEENHITKVELIKTGYESLKERIGK